MERYHKIKIAIIGYGNLGKGVKKAIGKHRDMILAEIITRRPEQVTRWVKNTPVFSFEKFEALADVAILCGGSKQDIFGTEGSEDLEKIRVDNSYSQGQGLYFAQFFNTVDSFDTHRRIVDYYNKMNKVAKFYRRTAIVSAGWDPGIFSVERVLAKAFIPHGKVYSFWGPGVSQGHSDAVRKISGVLDARSYTIPIKETLDSVRQGKNPEEKPRMLHKRVVYVLAHQDADRKFIEKEIRQMRDYFSDYDTKIIFVSKDTMQKRHGNFAHRGSVILNGKTDNKNRAIIEYRCAWDSNPEATAEILVACARACYRMHNEKKYGAFTMLDIPPFYYSTQDKARLLETYV